MIYVSNILDINNIMISIVDDNNLKAIPILSREEENELFLLLKSDDSIVRKRAYDKIFYCNIRLVSKYAFHYSSMCNLSYDDLFMEGCDGLLEAIRRYDCSIGNKFSTYACEWIMQRINVAINNCSSIRIPFAFKQKMKIYRREKYKYSNGCYTIPFYDYLVSNTSLTMDDIILIERNMNDIISMDEDVGNDVDVSFHEVVSDNFNVEEVVEERVLTDDYIETELCNVHVSERDREIFYYKFGFYGYPLMNLDALGDKYGISHQRVAQIIKNIINKIKDNNTFIDNVRVHSEKVYKK